MEDEERQKKLETGKAKLAEYRQRKAHADSQRKKKKKKKSEEESQGSAEPDRLAERDDDAVGGQHGTRESPTVSELSFAKTLRSGETVKHDQTYTIEPESEVSTTAEDYSSEQVNGCREMMTNLMTSSSGDFFWEEAEREEMKRGKMQDIEEALVAKTRAVEELSQELEDIRAAFGTEGVQKLQDFEAALKQRDGIITQLTANLQQAREEKDEIMKEFLALTEQSQKLQIQFQQLQAGETLRNTSHTSTAADLLQARQQLAQYQLQLEEVKMEAGKNQVKSDQQQELIGQLQRKIGDMELSGRRSEESFTQKLNEKDFLIAEKEKVIINQDQSLAELRTAEESLATMLKEKNLLLSEQTASLNLFREEIAILGRSANDIQASVEKDLIIAEQERVISERDCSLSRLEQELESSRQSLRGLQQRVSAKESELEKCLEDLQNTKCDLESSKGEMESCKSHLEKVQGDLQSCQIELNSSRQREKTSSDEIKQLMGTVEDLQKRCHRDSLSEGDIVQRMQQETAQKLDLLRAELDEMYGQQIVHMKQELNLQNTARMEQATAEHQAEMERQLHEAKLLKEQNLTVKETLNVKIQELQAALAQSANEFNREKFNLQAELQNLRGDLRSAKEKAELASNSLISQESQQDEMQRLLVTVEDLQRQLAAAGEAALEAETQHESETTNYKIKLEMLEREKDAVLDRMAESQEAELERLRTHLLFSHEEELTHLRQELRRESFLNAENLLNEASVKHQKSLDDLRRANEDQLHLLQREKVTFSNEREELLQQINGLKEDLKMALHNSRSDELVRQLQELQVELEDLRKTGEQRVRLENENETLLKNVEVLEEKERKWKGQQQENDSKMLEMEKVVSQLREEIEKQRTTFSFAEKNFDVNYQELKEEYSCLIDAKTQLEERTLKEALEFQAKIAGLQSQIGELEGENVKRSAEAVEKASELTEKLHVTLLEKESLTAKLSQVTEELVVAENKTGQLSEELEEVKRMRGEDHHDQIRSLRGEVESLQTLLKAAEAERDSIRRTLERPVEGRASPQKPVTASAGSNRRKRRQRLKQERRVSGGGGPLEAARQREEEEEEEEDESRATSAAESEMQTESQVRGDETDGCQGDSTIKQGECKLQMEVQRISLTELLQEETDCRKDTGDQDIDKLQMLKAEALEKQGHLEESHRIEMERLRAQYMKSNAETEERCAAELAMLRRQVQELTDSRATDSGLQSSQEQSEEHEEELKDLSDEQLSRWVSGSRSGLSAKLQALRKALYNEYIQEVAALKEQHRTELSRLRQQLERERTVERRDTNGLDGGAVSSSETAGVAGQSELRRKQRVEEEVAKAIVQMSVEYAQQTELARINKLACQTSAAMQTQSDGEEDTQEKASTTLNSWLKEERECLEKELRDRNAEIQKLREKLRRAESGAEKPLQMIEDGEGKVEDEDSVDKDIDKDNERTVLRRANERLGRVLADILKTTAAAEETMGLHMQSLKASSSAGLQTSTPTALHIADLSGKSSPYDSFLLGEDEGHLMGLSSRLQTALEKMLTVITDTTNQVEHARITQTELMRESFRHNQEISELLQKQEELQERLAEEARAREQLALELHRAEGLIDGYTGERAALEEQLRQKEELQLNLEQDLQVTASRLQELEQERLQMQEERELVSRQQDAMRETAGPRELCLVEAAMVAAPEADLLEETEKLMKEKVEVQRQAEKESADFLKQMKVLEAELEEQVNRVIELEHARETETGDLQQQIQALEKQLDKNRRFLDEQAVDREHERDVFQNEISELEQQLKNQQKLPSGSEQRSQQVEQLSSQLKEKADWCSELLLGSEQLRRELTERDQEIDKLESRVRELEQALLARAESLEKDEQKMRHASITEAKHTNLEAQLHTEREALERKEKEICHLEEQLEQFREELENKSEEVQQLQMQLEIQRKEICSQQQFLETRESMLQVMEEKDRAIALLNEQNTKLQHLEKASGNKGIDQRDALINDLESQVECLKSGQERLKRKSEEEVEQLNSVIDKLQQDLVHMERKDDVEAHVGEEYEEMKQRMDAVTKEFSALKLEHADLLETHQRLKESAENSEELAESLRQKTASLLVAQAQVQALEKSAASSLDELQARIRELENEKDTELSRCQKFSDELQVKVSTLEEHLREKVAAEVVSQATLDALQQQVSKDQSGDKVGQLNQKLDELETSLGGIEKNNKLRKQLLSRSKEELAEYERRLVALVDLMRLMVGPQLTMTADLKASASDQALLSELQQAREESVEAKKQLDLQEEQCHHLKEQLKDKTETVQRLKEQFEKASSEGAKETQALREELAKTQKEAMVSKEELSSCKENLEKLQDLLQERELTINHLKEELLQLKPEENKAEKTNLVKELQEVQSNADFTKDELDRYKSQNEKLQEDIKKQEVSISKLQDELQEVQKNMDFTKEEVSSFKSHNEKLQEDIQLREVSILKLKEELQEVQKNMDVTKEEVSSYKSHNEKLQEDIQLREVSILKLKEELQEVQKNKDTTKELNSYKSHNEKLQEDVRLREESISRLEEDIQEVQNNMATTKEELNSYKSHNEKLIEDIQQQKVIISKLEEEIQRNLDSTNDQVSSFKSHNEKLQVDIQVCEDSILKLKEELKEVQNNMDSTKEELNNYKSFNEKLQEDVETREVSISKLKEELQEVKKMVDCTQELKSDKSCNEKLQEEIQVHEVSITKLKQELQEVQKTMDLTKEELENYKSHNEKLQEEIQLREVTILNLQEVQKNVDSTLELRTAKTNNEELGLHEVSVSKLKKELQELKKFADTTKEELRNSKSHNEKLKDELREARAAATKAAHSSSASPSPAASPQPSSSSSSTSQPKRKASSKQPLSKVTKEKTTPVSRKSAAPSRTQEPAASNATTQTAANEDLQDVVGEFREKVVQMQELHAAEILDMEARHISESDALRRDVQNLEDECKTLKVVIDKLRSSEVPLSRQDRLQSQFKDGYTSDSSSDYSQRTGYDLPVGLQQEFRVTPEGAGRDADDSVLPDRIKSLLREVHQEGMHVLSLSDLPVSESDPGGTSNLWLKERDALLATVESLKALIAHMQTTQISGDSADWRAQLLEAVRQVFVRERSVLKSVLYSQLDEMDTSDAVIHLNQLELKLAEQDAQHKEAMSSLHAADRSSLMAEIYPLRVQLERFHQGARPAVFSGAKEQGRGGDADGATHTDRLLLEELKGELSQTKIELETTLISQQKHLKELDALRAEVSQKASEVDALNEQLLEESRKGRELQWTVEKERCRAGRSEENALEQLEDLNLALEEQKSQAEQLTATLEQERQESSRLCQQAEKEKLSFQRRLRELQVQLETQQAKAQEMKSAMGTARELHVGGSSTSPEENLLEGLHKELDDKQAQVLDLLSQIEAVKLEVLRKDEELNQVGLESRQNHEAMLNVQARLEKAESRLSETRNQLANEESRRRNLEEDKKQLEERFTQDSSAGRGTPHASQHQHHHGPWRTADTVLGKLHLVASKIRSMACEGAAEINKEELLLLQSSVDDVISMLQQSPALPSIPESAALLAGGSSSSASLTERLLRQNAELTGFVGRLTEEKNDLRNHSLRLEEELRCCRHAGDTYSGRRGAYRLDSADAVLLSQEKEALSQEKVHLEKALDQALAQVARLKGEIRTDTLRQITGPEADNAVLKRMYGRYLRSESFRKALIYQKKYLLLLLGGFQECEEATLALLSRMGGRPPEGLGGGSRWQRSRGLMRFRSAVRVSIALSRMRFLVKRWHKTTGMSNTSCIAQKCETTRIIGTDGRDYLHPGVDVFRDRGGSSNRGRSGRESPRSPISAAQHRFHAAGDPGLLTCAHLQSYDPDRALTDYISRLEALQRRLGSVTSGASSSLAPLHFSLRR
ncbi:A-kinase anchor protein 9 isoform X3 [Corythoichthys intestinalis]|uniref:A-kinase anchor protein 9 isoform X3 n=1 Tax=Corythoichthys intestinalis TaxID=161448 RepID=UPI0025A5DF51|nr:A-kinase anchor protein 9 isoform X3 [Corythoichthys intestinalis]